MTKNRRRKLELAGNSLVVIFLLLGVLSLALKAPGLGNGMLGKALVIVNVILAGLIVILYAFLRLPYQPRK